MKKHLIIKFFYGLLTVFLLISACSKNLDIKTPENTTSRTGELDKKEARRYYGTLIKERGNEVTTYSASNQVIFNDGVKFKSTAGVKSDENHMFPVFRLAHSFEYKNSSGIEVPLLYSRWTALLIIEDKDRNRDIDEEKAIFRASFDRLVIYKNKQSGQKNQYIVTFVPDIAYLKKHNGDISHNHINKLDDDFNGYLIYREFEGKRQYYRRIENGKSVRLMRFSQSNGSTQKNQLNLKSNNGQAPNTMVTPMSIVCETIMVPVYTVACVSLPETGQHCTEVFSHYEEREVCHNEDDCSPNCEGDPGGGGTTDPPISHDVPPADHQLPSTTLPPNYADDKQFSNTCVFKTMEWIARYYGNTSITDMNGVLYYVTTYSTVIPGVNFEDKMNYVLSNGVESTHLNALVSHYFYMTPTDTPGIEDAIGMNGNPLMAYLIVPGLGGHEVMITGYNDDDSVQYFDPEIGMYQTGAPSDFNSIMEITGVK